MELDRAVTHYKVRPRPRPRAAPVQPERCGERGCREPWTAECWLYDMGRGSDTLAGRYCGAHAESNGFCRYCAAFAAGTEGFEFGRPSGLCDNCRSSLQDDVDDWGDDDDDPDLGVLEHGYLDPDDDIDRKVELFGGR